MTMTETTHAPDATPADARTLWADGIPFGDAEQAADAASLLSRDSGGGRVVHISHRHAWTADAAWLALMEANDPIFPKVMARGSELVRMTDDGLEPYTPSSLRDRLSRIATFMRRDAVQPPLDIANTILARTAQDYWHAPFIDTVTDVPTVSASGELIVRPGYHLESRLFYRPSPQMADVAVPDVEYVDDVEAARDFLLKDLLGDFGFADDASRANALGLLLLPFVREFIGDEPTPLHAIVASGPGVGKSYLAQACLIPACGRVGVTTMSRDGDEDRKRLTANFLTAPQAIILDNISESLESGHLAAALTTGEWRDRRLGHTEYLTLKVRNAWVATGNGMTMSNELARRTTLIVLDPGDVRPSDRPASEYRHSDLHGWALQNRAALATAALTLVKHWLDGDARLHPSGEFLRDESGRTSTARTLGSFTRWSEVVGGILAAAGVHGFLDNRNEVLDSVDVETEEGTAFIEAWREWKGDAAVSVAELAMACTIELREVVPSELLDYIGPRMEGKLRAWLGKRVGRHFGHLTLTKVGRVGAKRGGNPIRWAVR